MTTQILECRLYLAYSGNRLCFKFLYLDILKFLDVVAFVSWHMVSSRVEIDFFKIITISGLKDLNTPEIGRYVCPMRSTKISHSSFIDDINHFVSISSTESCLLL